MRNAIDCATKLNATSAAALVKQGVSHVGRYLGHSWKGLEKAEADAIKAAGLAIFSIFEKNPTNVSYFTYNQGKADALEGAAYASELGQPKGSAIYFTVDYDVQPNDFDEILAYFKGVHDNLKGYQVGAYGPYSVLTFLKSQNAAKYFFQTVAWSRGHQCNFNHIFQYQIEKQLAGINVDLVKLEQNEIGSWGNDNPNLKSQPKAPQPVYHLVQTGDTVSKLAKQFGSTIDQMKAWNNLDNKYTIYAGKKIRVK
jgi:hypothetical protein